MPPSGPASAAASRGVASMVTIATASGAWRVTNAVGRLPDGRRLVLGARILMRPPPSPPARFLCLHIHHAGSSRVRQLCFGAPEHGKGVLGYGELRDNGSIKSFRRIKARVRRPTPRSVMARFRAGAAGLSPHVYYWRYLSHWRGRACTAPPPSGGGISLDVEGRGQQARRQRDRKSVV